MGVRRFLKSLDRTSHIMKLIVFSLLLAYAMAVPAPEAAAEPKPEAEADPAVLYSTSYATYGYPYYGYYAYPAYYGYYGHYLGKRSAEPEPRFGAPQQIMMDPDLPCNKDSKGE